MTGDTPMTLTELSIKRPILIIVFYTCIAVLGIISFANLRYELLPKIATPYVTVTVVYPGASPTDVEQGVTKVIENAVAGIENIKRITSSSNENVSSVMIEFRSHAKEEAALQSTQRKVNEVLSALPEDAKPPIVSAFALDELPVLTLSVESSTDNTSLSQLLTQTLRPRLAQLSGVADVNFLGTTNREIRIELSADALSRYAVSVSQVLHALHSAHIDVPTGSLKTDTYVMSVRSTGKFSSVNDLLHLRLFADSTGSAIVLGDVASITDSTADREIVARQNGTNVIVMNIQKQRAANAVEVSEVVRNELQKIESEYEKEGIKFTLAYDSSSFTLEAVHAVQVDLWLAIGLVALVMLVFLHSFRDPLIVMVAIPTSLLTGFIGMFIMGFSLNLMTLLAMSLAIGILVDDAMVVHENIHRHLTMGKEPRKAALDGRNEIGFSALSITLVDVVVFLPMSFVPGLVGSIVREFALTMVISTLASLIVSFTLTPMLASRFAKHEHLSQSTLFGKFGVWFEQVFARITGFYTHMLASSLRYSAVVIVFSFVLLGSALLLPVFGIIGTEFMTQSDRSRITVGVELQPGTALHTTDSVVKSIETALRSHRDIERVHTTIGASSEGMLVEASPNSADVAITLKPKSERQMSQTAIIADIQDIMNNVPGIKARVSTIGIFGTANDAPIIITLSGVHRESIHAAMDTLYAIVRAIPGIDDVRTSRKDPQPEVRIAVDHTKLAERGITFAEIAPSLRTSFAGNTDLSMTLDGKQVPMRVQLQSSDRTNPDVLRSIMVPTPHGDMVAVHDIADIVTEYSSPKLERRNRNNALVLYATVSGRASGDVGADIQAAVRHSDFPKDVAISYEGDLELQDDAFEKLGYAFAAAVLFVYLIMVALYNSWLTPFIVLFSVPVAIVGALVALMVTHESLTMFSLLGCIMLVGLVAKNAILLVDAANQYKKEGYSLISSVIKAGTTRLRPIVMTTVAMVIGMLPVALAKGAGAEWKNGLAWVLIGGLTSSMVLTLILVPNVYIIMNVLRERFARLLRPLHGIAAVILLIMAASEPLSAQKQQSGVPLSLRQAVDVGVRNNSQVQIDKLEEERSVLRTKEISSNFLPQIHATGQYIRNVKAPVFFFPSFGFDPNTGITIGSLQPINAELRNTYFWSVNASVPLLHRELTMQKEMSSLQEKMQKEYSLLHKTELRVSISRAYYDILALRSEQKAIASSIRSTENILTETLSLWKKGMLTDADTLRAFAQLVQLRSVLTQLQADDTVAVHTLGALLGFTQNTMPNYILTDSLSLNTRIPDMARMNDSSVIARHDLVIAQYMTDIADKSIDMEQAQHYPTITALAGWRIQSQSDNFNVAQQVFPNSSFLGVQIDIPLFQGFRTHHRTEYAEIGKKQSEQYYDKLKQDIIREVEGIVVRMRSAEKKLAAQKVHTASVKRIFSLTQARFIQGMIKYNELNESLLQVLQAETEYIRSVYEYKLLEVELEKTIVSSST